MVWAAPLRPLMYEQNKKSGGIVSMDHTITVFEFRPRILLVTTTTTTENLSNDVGVGGDVLGWRRWLWLVPQ